MNSEHPGAHEEVIEPQLPIIDAHHHLMDRPGMRYLLDDILKDTNRGHRVVGTVYIENRAMLKRSGPELLKPVGETEFANGVAAMSASGAYGETQVCAAIVSYADLRHGAAVSELLDGHEKAGGGRFRGIRQGTYWDQDEAVWQHGVTQKPPPEMLSNPAFREGFAELVSRGLSFDAALFHPQIPELTSLAQAFDDAAIILNHMGFPLGVGQYEGRRDEVFQTWQTSMKALSACENVRVKLGGCGITLWGFGFDLREQRPTSEQLARAWRPYIETCIELFGSERCMFESNFPPDRVSADYVPIWNAFKKLTREASDAERRALFYDTAARTYRISSLNRESAESA